MFEKITVNQCLHFSTVFGAVIKCKDYSWITLESGTHVKSIEKYIEYICSVYCETVFFYSLCIPNFATPDQYNPMLLAIWMALALLCEKKSNSLVAASNALLLIRRWLSRKSKNNCLRT